jgi:hypothetical protein
VFCPKQRKKPEKKRILQRLRWFFYVDITEVHTEEGKLYLFVGIDRMSKMTFVKLYDRMRGEESVDFLGHLLYPIVKTLRQITS